MHGPYVRKIVFERPQGSDMLANRQIMKFCHSVKDDFADVTLVCEDGQWFEAHKVILAAKVTLLVSAPPTFSILSANLLLKVAETSAEVSALKKLRLLKKCKLNCHFLYFLN